MTVSHVYLFNLDCDGCPIKETQYYLCCPAVYCCDCAFNTCNFKGKYYGSWHSWPYQSTIKLANDFCYLEPDGTLGCVYLGFYDTCQNKYFIETSAHHMYSINTPAEFCVDDSRSTVILRNAAFEKELTSLNDVCYSYVIPLNAASAHYLYSTGHRSNDNPASLGYTISPVYNINDASQFNVCKQYLATNNIATRQPAWTNEACSNYCYNGDTNCTITQFNYSCPACSLMPSANLEVQKENRVSYSRPFGTHCYQYPVDSSYAHCVCNAYNWCDGVGAVGNFTCVTGKQTNCNLLTQVCWITTLCPIETSEKIFCCDSMPGRNPMCGTCFNDADVYNGYATNSRIALVSYLPKGRGSYGYYCWCYQMLPYCTDNSRYTPESGPAVRVVIPITTVYCKCCAEQNYSYYGCSCKCDIPSLYMCPSMACLNTLSNGCVGSQSVNNLLPSTGSYTCSYLFPSDRFCYCPYLPHKHQYWKDKTTPADTSILATMGVVQPVFLYFSFCGRAYNETCVCGPTGYYCIRDFLCNIYCNCRITLSSTNPNTYCYRYNNAWYTVRIPVVPKRECLVKAIQCCSTLDQNGAYNINSTYISNVGDAYRVGDYWFGLCSCIDCIACCYDTSYYCYCNCFPQLVNSWKKNDSTTGECYVDMNCFYNWLCEFLESYDLELFKGYALTMTMCPFNRYDTNTTTIYNMYATNSCYADPSYMVPGGRGTCPDGITNFACPERNAVTEYAACMHSILSNMASNCCWYRFNCCYGTQAQALYLQGLSGSQYGSCTDFWGWSACCYCSTNNTWHVEVYDYSARCLYQDAVTLYYDYNDPQCICQLTAPWVYGDYLVSRLRSYNLPGADDVSNIDLYPDSYCRWQYFRNSPRYYYCHELECYGQPVFYPSYSCYSSICTIGSDFEIRNTPQVCIDYTMKYKTYFKGWPTAEG